MQPKITFKVAAAIAVFLALLVIGGLVLSYVLVAGDPPCQDCVKPF